MAGAGAYGGIARRRPDQQLAPSSGLPPPPPSTQVPFLTIVGPTGQLLVYVPTRAAQNLLASIAARAFNDGLPGGGNGVLPGIVSYTPGSPGLAPIVQMNDGTLLFWPVPPGSSGLVAPGLLGVNGATGNDALILQAPQNTGHNQAALILQSALTPQLQALGAFYLAVQANVPPALPGFVGLYADAFGQIHTPAPFQSDIDVEIANLGAPPGAGGSGAKSYSTSGHRQIIAGQASTGGDGNSYDVERLTIPLTALIVINQQVFSQTVFSHALGIGTYRVKVRGNITEVAAAGIPEFAFTYTGAVSAAPAPLITAMFMEGGAQGGGGSTPSRGQTQPGIGTANFVNSFTMRGAGSTDPFDIELMITTTSAGTLAFVAATSIAVDTFHVDAGTEMTIEPVVAV